MLTQFTITNLAQKLATEDFNKRCALLDTRLEDALTKALNSEKRMSVKSRQRVIDMFCKILLKK